MDPPPPTSPAPIAAPTPVDQEICAAKRAWRVSVRQQRAARRDDVRRGPGSPDRLAAAEAIAAGVVAHLPPAAAEGQRRTVVAAYQSLPTEPPTQALLQALVDAGCVVVLPVLLPDKDLSWAAIERFEGSQGSERFERTGEDVRLGPDLGVDGISAASVIVVPALSIDPTGGRLGQGGGSYDRALVRRDPHALVIGVVFDEEFLDGATGATGAHRVPRDAHDQGVNAVVCASGRWIDIT